MRSVISILLVAIATGTGYSGPVDCCNFGGNEEPAGYCHHVSARPTRCHQVPASGCADFICELEGEAILAPVNAGIQASTSEFTYVLAADRIRLSMRNAAAAAAADHAAVCRAFEKLFLWNQVLLI